MRLLYWKCGSLIIVYISIPPHCKELTIWLENVAYFLSVSIMIVRVSADIHSRYGILSV